jgi:3-hydroxyisobutyrate dehydrogenase-like beta-hydroxyacid dehydrogenase
MKLGFIGFGEAAFSIASGLGENGFTGIIANDKMQDHPDFAPRIKDRASKANVELKATPQEVVEEADVVISAVQSSFAVDVCDSIKDSLREGQIYADVSASSPTIKQEIWEKVKDTGVLFADAAMMGMLTVRRHEVPISACGNGAQAFADAVNPIGMKVKVVSERVGVASAIKLIRSIYMKGYDSLIFEMLRAADAFDVYDEMIENVAESMDGVPFATLVDWMLPGIGIHAKRRAHEMDATVDMLAEKNIDSSMSAAIRNQLDLIDRLNLSEEYKEGWPEGKSWREVIHHVNEITSK